MKATTYLRMLFVVLLVGCSNLISYGQDVSKTNQKTNTKLLKEQQKFYRHSLQIDSAKADVVLNIQETYKSALNKLMVDTINGVKRRDAIRTLMDKKNSELRKVLNSLQQAKIIPASEKKIETIEVKKY